MQTAAGIHRIFPRKMEGDEPRQGKQENKLSLHLTEYHHYRQTKEDPSLRAAS
jgi:hypothetical protein